MTPRVLHIISSTMRAGVAAMVMNMYRELDRESLQFDFVAHHLGNDDFDTEIERLGGRVFRIPFLSEAGIPGFVRHIRGIIETYGPYAAVHAHTDYQSGFCALAATQAGVPIRICHAHSDTRYVRSPLFWLKKRLGRALIDRYVTQRCACSDHAGLSTFGRRAVHRGLVTVVPNGIDPALFADCPPETGLELRRVCRVGAASRIIGCVGRLSREKNPEVILDMADAARKTGRDFRFVFIGTGALHDALRQRRDRMDLADTVFFLSTRSDVPNLMQSLDLAVVPSYTEGFSLAALEAQAAGTPVLASAGVPRDADMGLGLFHTRPLSAGALAWVTAAAKIMDTTTRPDAATRADAITRRGYNAKTTAARVLALYGMEQGQATP